MRNLYKSTKGPGVWEYSDEQVAEGHVLDHLVLMTQQEADDHLNPPQAPLTREMVNELRRSAYADPLTGSDPLYIKYQRDIESGASAEVVKAAKEAWLGRTAEIAAGLPWPE